MTFTHEEKMKAALAIIVDNLEGRDFIDSLTPISPNFAMQLANMARAAYFNEPHGKLDEAMEKEK